MLKTNVILPSTETVELLNNAAERINCPAFVADDPVQFPRRYSLLQDVEIVALLTVTIAWGRRPMIIRDAEKMLKPMGEHPYDYVMRGDFSAWSQQNVHRTFFATDLVYYMKGLRHIYESYQDLNSFFRSHGAAHAWDVAALLHENFCAANGCSDSQCIPEGHSHSALKRLNMALRWMVRNDGIVDMGLWDFITPAQLYIPLDVHVINTARQYSLLTRRSIDRKAAEELTALLRQLRPDDPVYYDYALFGLGV